jgi:hypothetical protein
MKIQNAKTVGRALRARRSYGQETKRLAGFALIGQEMTPNADYRANFSAKTPLIPWESFKLQRVAYGLRAWPLCVVVLALY